MMTEANHDKPKAHQTRVPLHERGINIDKLVFEYDDENLYMVCKDFPNIILLPSKFERHYQASFAYLRVDNVVISFMLGNTGDLSNYRSIDTKKELLWVIKDIGIATPTNVFGNSNWVPAFRFLNQAELAFTLTLLERILLSCDYHNKEDFDAGRVDYKYEAIRFAITDELQARIDSGEFING